YQYYLKHMYKLGEDYNPADFKSAVGKSLEMGEEKFPLGVIYKTDRPAYHEHLEVLKDNTLIARNKFADIEKIMSGFI
ncbi:MAG: 2-oxoacid ferredoxin oxidoreductase, partial [Ignavibacteria bacterium]|nr:2-oxoacid ferredoxin oxidoreductase [Ignavibacteria bacterium]